MKTPTIPPAMRQHFDWLERMKKLTAWPPAVAALAKQFKQEREDMAALPVPPAAPPSAPRPELDITINVI